MSLISKEAEAAYQTHAQHVHVRDKILKPLFAGESPVLAMDYEWDKPVCPIDWKHSVLLGGLAGLLVGALLSRR